jgi:hypothetical protein
MPQHGGGGVISVNDGNAIHVNQAAEINAIAEKAIPANADLLVIEDSADGNAKKKLQIGNLPAGGGGGADPNAIHDNIAGEIHAIADKAAPVAADELVIEDSAAAWAKKRVALTTLLATGDGDAIHDNVVGEISAVAEKAVPIAADLLLIEDSAAANAKKKVQIGNLPGGSGLGYTLPILALAFSPTDSSSWYFGCLPRLAQATEGWSKIYIPKAGTIKRVDIESVANTAGSNEDWSLYVRLNATSDTLIETVAAATMGRRWSNTGLAIAVAAGDYVEIKSVHPAWATNPVNATMGGHLYIE